MKFVVSSLLLGCAVGGAQDLVVPVLNEQVPDFTESLQEGSRQIDLNDYFATETVLPDMVRKTAVWDDAGVAKSTNFDFILFKDRTPLTRDNFLGYVSRDDYQGSFVHRVVGDFVIQGGQRRIIGSQLSLLPLQATLTNESGVSNTAGTLSMAKVGGNPDSATSQWFISLSNNSDNLDFQNGGFTVFGRISRATFPNTQVLNYASPASEFAQSNNSGPGGFFSGAPVHETTIPGGETVGDFFLFSSVTEVPVPADQAATSQILSYSFEALAPPEPDGYDPETDPPLVPNPNFGASLTGGVLTLDYTNTVQDDFISYQVTAEDSVGNVVTDIFMITISDVENYATWRAANFSGASASDELISGPEADPNMDGITNLQAFAQGYSAADVVSCTFESVEALPEQNTVELTFRYRSDLGGTRVVVERSRDLVTWSRASFIQPVGAIAAAPVPLRVITVPENEETWPETFYRLLFLK